MTFMRCLAAVAATVVLFVGMFAPSSNALDDETLTTAAEQTVGAMAAAINERDAATLCHLVLAIRDSRCETNIRPLLVKADRSVTLQRTTATRVGDFVKVQAHVEFSDGEFENPESTLWIPVEDTGTVVRPGRFLLRALGLEAEHAATDARPMVAADLQQQAGGTTNAKTCHPRTVASAQDEARDVKASTGIPVSQARRAAFDIRTVRLGFSPSGGTCITVKFAKPIHAGLYLELSLVQERFTIKTSRVLMTTSILFEPFPFTAVATEPADMSVSVERNTATVLLKPGAVHRSRPWRLQIEAVADDSFEPLIVSRQSAYDTAVLLSPHSTKTSSVSRGRSRSVKNDT